MRNIVVPIDFSGDSVNALNHAIVIANRFGYNITMIHVEKKRSYYSNSVGLRDSNEDTKVKIGQYFEQIIKKFDNEIETHIDYNILHGKIHQEIINHAKYSDAYLIVMGTHGISGFEERWIGSNAYRVVSDASCPVITIRNDYTISGFKKIVIPIDASAETLQKVPFIADFAKNNHSKIFIASINNSNKNKDVGILKQHTKQIEEFLKSKDIEVEIKYITGRNLADLTIEYALEIGAQLIGAMLEQIDSQMNIWLGPNSQQLVNHSPIPVLSFQPY